MNGAKPGGLEEALASSEASDGMLPGSRPTPVSIGLSATTDAPNRRSAWASATVTQVFPTPVPVPRTMMRFVDVTVSDPVASANDTERAPIPRSGTS